jgi:penicillin-binding protein 1A
VKRFLKITFWTFLILILLGASTATVFWYMWSSNLPYIGSLKDYRPPIITEVLSDDGQVVGRFYEENRVVVPLEDLPIHLIEAFVAAEDARFFEHEGVDFLGIFRAFYKNVMAGKIEQGGSTITQQVTRSLLLKNTERTYRRKAREGILSMQIEKTFTKRRILFLYLNQIYLGQGAYGVEAAAWTYFNRPAKELTLAQSALLAGLPQAPARYSPVKHFNRAKARQKYVLQRMYEEKYITYDQLLEALETKLDVQVAPENPFKKAPYFTEHVRRYLLEKFGRDILYRGGLTVYTTLNLKMQSNAREAVLRGTSELDKREGYRGALKHLEPGDVAEARIESEYPPEIDSVVESLVEEVDDQRKEVILRIGEDKAHLPLSAMKWARKPNPEIPYYSVSIKKPSEVLRVGDVILARLTKEGKAPYAWEASLEQQPRVEGSLFCMVPETGEVKAMIGGRNFFESQFNRAIQARRQPGSAFKPIIYAAALDWGMSPADILMDAPYISDTNLDEEVWKPKNYRGKFFGPTLFRTALAKSRNVITIKILKKIGLPYAISYARKMGIESELSPDLSLSLGSSGLSLIELTRSYAVFAGGGRLAKPIFIKRIVDRNGGVIEETQPESTQVMSKETAYVITDLLKAVIKEGTGWRAKALKRPAAGKTGTTNHLWDAWFMGYTPGLATGVWVGYDDLQPMGKGETGSRAACPIWLYFMSDVLKDKPVIDFEVPSGIVFAKIDVKTGLLASPYSEETVLQAFREGTEPNEHSPKPVSPKSGQFLQFDMEEDM